MHLTSSSEWYLKIGSNTAGPYTVQQIQTLLEDGDIQPFHKVTSTETKGEWMEAQELVLSFKAHQQAQDEANKKRKAQRELELTQSADFHAPDRPSDIGKAADGSRVLLDPSKDPALSLFETLQAVREKKSGLKILAPDSEEQSGLAFFKKLPLNQRRAILILILILALFAFIVLNKIDKNLKPNTAPEASIQQKSMSRPGGKNTLHENPPPPQTIAHPKPMPAPIHLPPKANIPQHHTPPKAVAPPPEPPRPDPRPDPRDEERARDLMQQESNNPPPPEPENRPDNRDEQPPPDAPQPGNPL